MKTKPYGYQLPRQMTKKQFKRLYSHARGLLHKAYQYKNKNIVRLGPDAVQIKVDNAYDLIQKKYGANIFDIICARSQFSMYFCILSNKKYDPGFVKAALHANSRGLSSNRKYKGNQLSLKDPNHKQFNFKVK